MAPDAKIVHEITTYQQVFKFSIKQTLKHCCLVEMFLSLIKIGYEFLQPSNI